MQPDTQMMDSYGTLQSTDNITPLQNTTMGPLQNTNNLGQNLMLSGDMNRSAIIDSSLNSTQQLMASPQQALNTQETMDTSAAPSIINSTAQVLNNNTQILNSSQQAQQLIVTSPLISTMNTPQIISLVLSTDFQQQQNQLAQQPLLGKPAAFNTINGSNTTVTFLSPLTSMLQSSEPTTIISTSPQQPTPQAAPQSLLPGKQEQVRNRAVSPSGLRSAHFSDSSLLAKKREESRRASTGSFKPIVPKTREGLFAIPQVLYNYISLLHT